MHSKFQERTWNTILMPLIHFWTFLWFFFGFLSAENSGICHSGVSKIYKLLHFDVPEGKLRCLAYQLRIFSTYRKSISIKRTNSHVHTTLRHEVSAEKLKFSSATYRITITMFKFQILNLKKFCFFDGIS